MGFILLKYAEPIFGPNTVHNFNLEREREKRRKKKRDDTGQ
jgi:DNA polymerase elongation subunit (family B)